MKSNFVHDFVRKNCIRYRRFWNFCPFVFTIGIVLYFAKYFLVWAFVLLIWSDQPKS